jgi:nucleotide-binding universal stress UspA family protein
MKLAEPAVRVGLKNILYLTDFSRSAEPACGVARGIAKKFESKVFAAHVLEPDEYQFVPQQGRVATTVGVEEAARKKLDQLAEKMEGIPHEVVIGRGTVWNSAAELIKTHEIDLLVVGTHGRTGLRRLLMGSVAEEILRQAPCPVITVGPGAAKCMGDELEFKNVLFATDFGPEAHAALPYALSIAQEFQAELTIVHVHKIPLEPLDSPAVLVAEAEKAIGALIPESAKDWCKPEYAVAFGEPGTEILKIARQRRADLIVLGVKRKEDNLGVATRVSPATVHKIVCEAPCPVLTVRR